MPARCARFCNILGVNNGDMSKGVLRVEPNISVMHKDDAEFRTRTEVKNQNSIRHMYRATQAEIERQIKLYESGDTVHAATLGWDEAKNRLTIQRHKESADEYRYFPEPDIPILEIGLEWIDEIRAKLPELPDAKRTRFVNDFGLSQYDAAVLTSDKAVADYYEGVLAGGADPKSAANWIITSLFGLMNKAGVERENIGTIKITSAQFAALTKLVADGTLNKGTATTVLGDMWETGADPQKIVEAKGLAQVSDTSAITSVIVGVLDANANMVEDYLGGKDKLFGALMGMCMKALKGQGNPQVVTDVLRAEIEKRRGS